MKKIVILLVILLVAGTTADAQLLDRLKERAKEAAEQNFGDKVEKGVNDFLNGKKKDTSSKTEEAEEAVDAQPAKGWTCPECGATGNTGKFCNECGAKKPEALKEAKGESVKSDFVPGDVVIFSDNLSGEQIGEFPSKWDLMSNNAEVAKMNGKMAIRFEHGSDTEIMPLIEDGNKDYLPDFFTLEMDFFVTGNEDNTSWYCLHCMTADKQVWDIRFGKNSVMYWAMKPNSDDYVQGSASIEDHQKLNDWNHFALSFNKRALKVYINGVRVANIPNTVQPAWFFVSTEFWEDHIDYLTNVRLAKGGVALYEQKATDLSAVEKAIAETGKFVTNNILFETGKATLKPESMEEIQKVAEYMKKNPSARFEVQGHTDNQGSDKVNDPLSQQRAEAVVKALEEQGVDPFNLRPVGKGSHEPVADNSTDEGRAKNRRVEFIKK